MDTVETHLETKGIRPTAMRLLVYKLLAEQKMAVGLSQIESAFEAVDRTTLYRTLKTFEKQGVVHQIDDGTGIIKYALCEQGCNCDIDRDLHLHFHCVVCEETHCLTDRKIPQINLPEGYVAQDVNLVVQGVCDRCNAA